MTANVTAHLVSRQFSGSNVIVGIVSIRFYTYDNVDFLYVFSSEIAYALVLGTRA